MKPITPFTTPSPPGGGALRPPPRAGPLTALLLVLVVTPSALPHRVTKLPSTTSEGPHTPLGESQARESDSFQPRTPGPQKQRPQSAGIGGPEPDENYTRAAHDDVDAEAMAAAAGLREPLLEASPKWPPSGRNREGIAEILEHPLGDTRFQFFLYDQEGNFVRRWITLQQIQDLLLSHRVRFVRGDSNEVTSLGDAPTTAPPAPMLVAGSHWDQQAVIQRPDVNIDGVVDTVHKVMADEVANTVMPESTTALEDQELVTLSTNLIHQLIRDQFFQFMEDNAQGVHANQEVEDGQPPGFDGVPADEGVRVSDFSPEERESETTEPFLESTEGPISPLQTDQFEKEIALLSADLLSNSNSLDGDYVDDSTIYSTTVTTDDSMSEGTALDDIALKKITLGPDGDESSSIKSDEVLYSTTYPPGDVDFVTETIDDGNAPSYTIMAMTENESGSTQNSIAEDIRLTTENIETTSQTSSNLNVDRVTDDTYLSFVTTKITSSENMKFTSEGIPTATESEQFSDTNPISTSTPKHLEYLNSTENITSIAYSPNDLIERISVGDYEFPNYLYDYDYDTAAAHFSNVLPPSQIATDAFHDDMDFNDGSDLPENYDYYSQKIYLDSETQDYYEKQYVSNEFNISKMSMPAKLDFPGKDVAASYHPVEVQSDLASGVPLASSSTTTSDSYFTAANHAGGGASTATTDAGSGPETLQKLDVSVPLKSNILTQAPPGNLGLEETTQSLSPTIKQFIAAMNDVAFKVYKEGAHLHRSRNFVLSPLNLISVLSMLLLGSRGNTSIVLADLLRTDDFRNFNPHLLLKNIRADVEKKNVDSNIAFSTHVFVELPRRNSVHSLDFFKQTIDYFYGSTAEEADWSAVGARARIRVNEAISNQTDGRVSTFLDDDVSMQSPFSIVSSALMQSSWSVPIVESDLFDMSFIRFPSAERRLVRTIGVSKRMTVNAGYSLEEDATVAEIPLSLLGGELSMILVLPGQQKSFVANGLKQIESRLTSERWSALMRILVPHTLTVQVPLFRHRSYTDVSRLLKLIGLDALFQEKEADYSGVNSIRSLHLADVVQLTEFHSCLLENSSFSFRSASFPSSSTSPNSRGAFQNEGQDSPSQDENLGFVQGANNLNASGKSESFLSPTWRLTKDASGFDEDDLELALKGSEKTLGNLESTNTEYSTHGERERKKKIFPVYQKHIGRTSERDNPLLKIEQSGSEFFEHLSRHTKTVVPNISKEFRVKRASQSNSVHRIRNSSLELSQRGELSRKKRNPHRRKHSRNEKGPTVAFDRAFMYVIRHNPTGLILHIGRYLDPI